MGMYMSGLLISSLGGRKEAVLPEPEASLCEIWRDQGLCRHGKRTRTSFLRTYALDTLK
jgi:hypothetical protein